MLCRDDEIGSEASNSFLVFNKARERANPKKGISGKSYTWILFGPSRLEDGLTRYLPGGSESDGLTAGGRRLPEVDKPSEQNLNPSMASLNLLPHSLLFHSRSFLLPLLLPPSKPKLSVKASINGLVSDADTTKPVRRRKKSAGSSPSKKPSRSRKAPSDEEGPAEVDTDEEIEAYDDGMDIPYDDPPLICCFGAAQKEFVPSVRVHDNQMHPDIYSQWKMLQWDPPEFSRAPGGPASNVAISHVRLGGRAAFMGKVGKDSFGDELVLMMNKEHVQTRAVKFDENGKTGCSYMRIKFDEGGRMRMETVKESAEDSLHGYDLNFAVLKEVIDLPGLSSAISVAARDS